MNPYWSTFRNILQNEMHESTITCLMFTYWNFYYDNLFYVNAYFFIIWLDNISGGNLPQSGKHQEVLPLPLCGGIDCGGIDYCAPPGICRWPISAAGRRSKEDAGRCDDATCHPPERTGCQATVVSVRRYLPLHCRPLPGHLHTSPCCC